MKGWVGNQLFQYSTGRALALKNGDTLKIDASDFNRHRTTTKDTRELDITKFNIAADEATAKEIRSLREPYGLLSYVFRRLRAKFGLKEILNFEPSILNSTGNQYLDGYFQSYKYFAAIENVLQQELRLKKHFSVSAKQWHEKIKKSTPSISIHIRRGDYVSNQKVRTNFGPCPIDYYERAIEKIDTDVSNGTYFVFSDDLEWVRENLPLPTTRTYYVTGSDIEAVEEMVLMSQCDHNIIANSSFSWWGAWLNQNEEKTIIAPTPWLDSGTINEDDLLPPDWIRMAKY